MWKLSSSTVKDGVFTTQVQEAFSIFRGSEQRRWAMKWVHFKEDIKMNDIESSSCLNYEKNNTEKEWQSTLRTLIISESSKPGYFAQDITKVKHQLKAIDSEK